MILGIAVAGFSAHGDPCAVCPHPDDYGIRKQPLQCTAGGEAALFRPDGKKIRSLPI